MYVVVGTWSIFPREQFYRATVMKHIIQSIFLHSIHCIFLSAFSRKRTWRWVCPWNLSSWIILWWLKPGGRQKRDTIARSRIYLRLYPPWVLNLRSESCIFDLVSTMSKHLKRLFSRRAVANMPIVLTLGVIMSSKTPFIVSWLSLYNFDIGHMGYTIDI